MSERDESGVPGQRVNAIRDHWRARMEAVRDKAAADLAAARPTGANPNPMMERVLEDLHKRAVEAVEELSQKSPETDADD